MEALKVRAMLFFLSPLKDFSSVSQSITYIHPRDLFRLLANANVIVFSARLDKDGGELLLSWLDDFY